MLALRGQRVLVSCSFFLSWFLHGPQVIEKFDYVFAENGTVQYKHGRLLSKQVSVPKACPQDTPLFHTGVPPSCVCHSPSLVFFTTDDPEPPGGGTPTGPDQLLPQLHGPAQTAQEAVRALTWTRGKRVGALVFYFLQQGL